MKHWLAGLAALAWFAPGLAAGQECGGLSYCCSVTATPVAFGVYSSIAAQPLDSTGSVEVSCARSGSARHVAFNIGLSPGQSGSTHPRILFSGPNRLEYNLFASPARNTVLGDLNQGNGDTWLGGSLAVGGATPRRSQSFTIYGRIPARQPAAPGSYVDHVRATVYF